MGGLVMSEPQPEEKDVLHISLDLRGIVARAVMSGRIPRGFRLTVTLPDGTIGSVEELRDIIKNGNDH